MVGEHNSPSSLMNLQQTARDNIFCCPGGPGHTADVTSKTISLNQSAKCFFKNPNATIQYYNPTQSFVFEKCILQIGSMKLSTYHLILSLLFRCSPNDDNIGSHTLSSPDPVSLTPPVPSPPLQVQSLQWRKALSL